MHFGIRALVFILAMPFAELVRGSPLDSWQALPANVTNDLFAVAFVRPAFVAVGSDGIVLRSTNSALWERIETSTTFTLRSLTSANGLFVAVGDSGVIVTSFNGLDWTTRYTGTKATLYGIAYGNGTFVVCGTDYIHGNFHATILTSTNGIVWSVWDPELLDELRALTFGAGRFVAASGSSGERLSSTDGVQWTRDQIGNHNPMHSAAYGLGAFVTAGDDYYVPGYPLTVSTDAVQWSDRRVGLTAGFRALAFGRGLFLAGGTVQAYFGDPTNRVYSSTNASDWLPHVLGRYPEVLGIAYGHGSFITVGREGTILRSAPFEQPLLAVGYDGLATQVHLTVDGELGRVWRLQRSVSLSAPAWVDVLSFTNTPQTVIKDAAVNQTQFYRLVSPP